MNPILFILLPAVTIAFITGAISTSSKSNRHRFTRPYRHRDRYR